MILNGLLLLPLLGGLTAWLVGVRHPVGCRFVSLVSLGAYFIAVMILWADEAGRFTLAADPVWLLQFDHTWIPQIGARYHLGLDGLSLLLLALNGLLGFLAVATSWQRIRERVGFFHFNVLLVVTAMTGLFLSMDLLLFYFFWEIMLVPLCFLIGIWGHERRYHATLKFFLFTQAGGLLMLVAILGLFFVHGRATGVYTFEYERLLGTASLVPDWAPWLMMGFFLAFAVKLPAFPLHTWLPDAYTEAPTAGSVLLAGIVSKAGAYGFLRFLVPLFPRVAESFSPVAMALGVIGILYGTVLAFAQSDLKRLVAYSSVSHMGFVLLGVFAWNDLALQGAVVIMIAHGLSTGGLFMLVGDLHRRLGTRDLNRMGGLWTLAPKMSRVGLILALASLGLPGLINFVGEFLVLVGVYKVHQGMAMFAVIGLILALVYSLWMIQHIFTGENREGWRIADYNGRELAIMAVIVACLVGLGMYPRPLLDEAQPSLTHLQTVTTDADLPKSPDARTQKQPPAGQGSAAADFLKWGR